MERPEDPPNEEMTVYSVIHGPVDLHRIEAALRQAFPQALISTYFSQAGSRELRFDSSSLELEGCNFDPAPGADTALNGVVTASREDGIREVKSLMAGIEATGHALHYEIYDADGTILFEQPLPAPPPSA